MIIQSNTQKMKLKIPVLVALLTVSLSASAQNHNKQFGFKSDNDAYLARGQDKYYTNGIFISYRFANKQKIENSALAKQITQLEVGQKMYNAQSGYIPDMVYVDRPITAYLYAGASKHWFYTSENSLSLGVQLGTIGPNALGRQAQEFIHKLGGFYPPRGWEYQLKDARENTTEELIEAAEILKNYFKKVKTHNYCNLIDGWYNVSPNNFYYFDRVYFGKPTSIAQLTLSVFP